MTTDSMPVNLLHLIESFVNEVRESKDLQPMKVGSATLLVVELESKTQKDPFAEGFRNFENAGSLAALFE